MYVAAVHSNTGINCCCLFDVYCCSHSLLRFVFGPGGFVVSFSVPFLVMYIFVRRKMADKFWLYY